ncbi:hypothetical protein AHF37_01433 [Paragonimus kellicotti]|nr:hypothetical protein AHF37_01433 [Paragonimus kellicotti]
MVLLVFQAHLVCYNKLLYNDFTKAADSPHGLAVLGIWVNISSDPSTPKTLLNQLGDFQLALPNITASNTNTTIKAFDLGRLLTLVDPKSYFRYAGSLTTPPCTPNVVWTVFRDSALITTQQVSQKSETKREFVLYLVMNSQAIVVSVDS